MGKNRSNTRQLIILLPPLIIVALGLGIAVALSGRVKMNPQGTVGNTAGNINNHGLFCEYNDTVYFSNPGDGGSLYAMTPDETDIRKLNSVKVTNILAGGSYLYYFQQGSTEDDSFGNVTSIRSFDRCNLNGKRAVGLTRDVVVSGQLVDNYLYLLVAGEPHPEFYKMKIDKSDKVHLADYAINPACAYNGMIYYNGTQDNHALCRLNTASDVTETIWNGNIWYPILNGDYIYYMDVSSNYRLCRYSLTQQAVEVLTNERVDCFNLGSGYIYYQTNDAANPQLKCMHMDGSNVLTIADGIYTNINMTSRYVYFQEFGEDGKLYHSALGSDWFNLFQG